MKTSTCFKGSYSLIVSYSRTVSNYFESQSDIFSINYCMANSSRKEELLIAYFTLLVGEHCSHMMKNRRLEHKHHKVLMISSLLMSYIITSL